MAIALSSLAASSPAGSQASGGSGVALATQFLQKADKRIQQQRELAAVQLSSLGKLTSTFADVRTATAALSDEKQTASEVGIRKVAGNFVKSFNSAVQSARSAAIQQGANLEGSRARTAEIDLRRSVGTDPALAELRRIGITPQPDGTLAIDSEAFDVALSADSGAVRSALSSVGQQVETAAVAQLRDDGNQGNSVHTLSERARSMESRQADPQALAAAARQTVSAQANRLNESLNSGAAAYQRVFSL